MSANRSSGALASLFAAICCAAAAQETLAPPPAVPVEPAPAASPTGESIVGIRVVGYQTVSPDTIAHYLGVKVGDPYDPEKIRANFHKLWEVGLLENVRIEAERAGTGVTLVVTIEERPIIKEVEFTGNKKISTSQIKDLLKENKIEVKAGAPLSLRDIARERSAISDLYVAQGFRSATVEFRIDDLSRTEKKVVFIIDEGDKVKIESITFTGNANVKAQTLRNAMKKTKVAVFWRILSENTVYSQANYEADVESIKGVYQARGFKDIVVKDPTLDVYVVDPKKEAKKIKRRVKITIPIVEGDKFFTNEIQITAVQQNGQPTETGVPTVFATEVLRKQFFELPPGSVLNRDRIVEAMAAMEAMYKSRGFIYWFADPQFQEVGDHKVDIHLKIFEGEKFYLGRLEVQGNTQTRDKVIRREFALDEGDVMDMEAVKKSITKIQQLGYFKMTEEPQFGVEPEQKKVNITIKGQETSRNEIQFGAGYSGTDGFFGSFSFQNRNFLGRGEILGASLQYGQTVQVYDLSYTVPWFLDRNQSVGASVFRRQYDYATLNQESQGGSAFYGKGLGLFDSVSLLYMYENIDSNYQVSSAPLPPGQPAPPVKFTDVSSRTSSLTPGYRYDSRNDPFDPTKGWSLTGTVQLADPVLGGESRFGKAILGATAYLPVVFPRRAYVGAHFEAGYLWGAYESDSVLLQRFQLGGEQSIRGYQTGSILPLDEDDRVFTDSLGRRLGGSRYFVLNLEYVFAQAGPAKLLAFIDAGNTYHESQRLDLSRLRVSYGLELRTFLPIFQAPLRFIYAFNLDTITPIDQYGFPIDSLKPKRSGFQFSIGRSF